VKAVEQPAAPQLAAAGEPSGRAVPVSRTARSYWWLQTDWLRHRNTIEDVHPLLVVLQEARGTGFLTVEHVLAILDAPDSDVRIRRWIEERPIGPPGRAVEDSQPRPEPAEAPSETAEQSSATVREAV
jgi:hypothetical protein